MPIDLEARRTQLQKLENEISRNLDSSETEARDTAPLEEVRDNTDDAVADEERDAQYIGGTRNYEQLIEVQAALKRIDAGTYGKCEACGREISAKRLDALPETKFCIEHARQHDPETAAATL